MYLDSKRVVSMSTDGERTINEVKGGLTWQNFAKILDGKPEE